MKKQSCALLFGLMFSLTARAGGYYAPYGHPPSYGYGGYGTPFYGSYAYPRAYPNYGFHEHRDFDFDRGHHWAGNRWGERHEWHERHEGGEGRGWGGRHEHG